MTDPAVPIIPAPPRPPSIWTLDYGNQLVRWLQNFADQLTGVYLLRGSGLFLPGLPKSAYGLKVDMVWNNDGVLTLVQDGDIAFSPVTAAGAVGTITVTP